MPIHQALQVSYASPQLGGSYFNRALGSDQILGRHLLPILRREQASLRRDEPAQFALDVPSDLRPLAFTGEGRELNGLAFLG